MQVLWARRDDKLFDVPILPLPDSDSYDEYFLFTGIGITGASLLSFSISFTRILPLSLLPSFSPYSVHIPRRWILCYVSYYSVNLKFLHFLKPIYDTFFLTFYNIFFTSWPILIFGLLEQNFTSRQLLDNLHLYRDIANNARMSWLQFFKWIVLGMFFSKKLLAFVVLTCSTLFFSI